jgi:hypothetical protein
MAFRGWYESFAKYRLEDGNWVKVFQYTPPERCRCGGGYLVPRSYGGAANQYYTDPDYKGRKIDTLPICQNCYNRISAAKKAAAVEKREREQLKRLQAKYKGN